MFQFVDKESFIHSLNPTIKFVGLTLMGLLLVLLFDPVPVLFLLGVSLFLVVGLARIPVRSAVRGILPFVGLGVGLAWVNAVFSQIGGEVIWQWGFIDVTRGSLRTGMALGLRVVTIVTLGYLFAATTDPRHLVASMVQQARLPYKMAFGLYIGFRFLPLLSSELDTLRAAHRVRGHGTDEGWYGRYRAFKRLAIPLFVSTIRKSIQLGLAMESKAFGAYPDRTYLFQARVTWRDWLFVLGMVALLVAMVVVWAQAGYLSRLAWWSVG